MAVKITAHNPWTWQDRFQFSQSLAVSGAERTIYLAGQVSADANGQLVHPRDMAKQIDQAMDNVEAVLKEAGVTLANVVRLNFYVTDMAAFMANHHVLTERLKRANTKPPGSAIGVATLYSPDALIEIEATAVA
jgi:enamine deaminase RidA (YjgF/YER057c/UK114 family)